MDKLIIYISILIAAVNAQPGFQKGDVRLINGPAPYNGTLQVYNDDEWRFVCDDGFGMQESIVVCRQLEYYPPNPQSPVCCQRADPPRYWLDNVRCFGNETRISQCSHRGWGNHNCGGSEAVGVRCTFRNPCDSNPCPSGSTCHRISNVRWRCEENPVEPKSPPGFRISLTGNIETVDGSNFTIVCTEEYGRAMELQAFNQIDRINDRIIGNTLCRDTSDFRIVVAGSSVSTNLNRGVVYVDFIKIGSGSRRYNDFYACSTEVSSFCQDFNNWYRPILPTPPGCPPVRFDPEVFRELSKDWYC